MGFGRSASSPTGTEMQRVLRRLSSHNGVHVRGGLISFQSSSLARLVPSQPLCFRLDSTCVLPDEAANRRCRSGSWVSVCSWNSWSSWSSQWSESLFNSQFLTSYKWDLLWRLQANSRALTVNMWWIGIVVFFFLSEGLYGIMFIWRLRFIKK